MALPFPSKRLACLIALLWSSSSEGGLEPGALEASLAKVLPPLMDYI